MATRPKAIIESCNGEKLSPITIAKNVLTDDGQNLYDILSDRKEDMMTPTIENSSSMFKVGQGDDVDYSANVVNGAYESMVLKGKTMVNCIQEPSSQDIVLPYAFEDGQYVTINDTKESGALGIELKGQTLVNSFITSYYQHGGMWGIIFFKSELMSKGKKYIIVLQHLPENCQWAVTNYDGSVMLLNYTEQLRGVFTSSLNGFEDTFALHINDGKTIRSLEELQKVKPMLIEYQEGMENWDIPYFEGMTSCKMPILSTTGKNLLDVESVFKVDGNTIKEAKDGSVVLYKPSHNVLILETLKVKANTIYTISCEIETIIDGGRAVYGLGGVTENKTAMSDSSGNLALFMRAGDQNSEGEYKFYNIQLEEGTTATTYEQHKTSILSLPEEVILRSLPNGVCDTFNTRTGAYTQRIGEYTYNGSEEWRCVTASGRKTTVWYVTDSVLSRINMLGSTKKIEQTMSISDKFPTYSRNDSYIISRDDEYVCSEIVCINDSRLTDVSVDGFKQWISQNPVTIQYQLATPIVTKVNLPSTLKSWNTTTHIYSKILENTLYPILSHSNPTYSVILKPSTKYSIVANSYSNNHTNSAINFNLGGSTASTTVGNRVTTITTPSTLSNELLTMSGRGNKLNNVMVIEGDVVGDEPYFEGICDCKSPILSNVGKNICDLRNYTLQPSYGNANPTIISATQDTLTFKPSRTDDWSGVRYKLKPNKFYSVTVKVTCNINSIYRVFFNNEGEETRCAEVANGAEYTRIFNGSTEAVTISGIRNSEGTAEYTIDYLSIIESPNKTNVPYEPYKSNILSCETYFDETTQSDKTIVLRSLPNGVCDTLNVETGEYVQRIGEVTKNNSTGFNLSIGGWENKSDVCTFENFKPEGMKVQLAQDKPTLNCDKVPSNTFSTQWNNSKGIESITQHDGGNIVLSITRDKLLTQDVDGLNTYLQSNPITIQYELATPIVSTIDIQGFPYSYTNGHVQLSSGSIEQSLTPKVEYSVATNRNGQIRSNQKMVERHQKQLDRLQAMILTNLVNTQYEQTLTNLKYDLKNVREEVK